MTIRRPHVQSSHAAERPATIRPPSIRVSHAMAILLLLRGLGRPVCERQLLDYFATPDDRVRGAAALLRLIAQGEVEYYTADLLRLSAFHRNADNPLI